MRQGQRAIDKVLLAPASISAGGTASATVDIQGYAFATLRINFAAEVNTSAVNPTVSVLLSDTTDATNYATVSANRAEDLVASKELRYDIDNKSGKRYLKLSVTAGTHTTNDLVTHGGAIVSLFGGDAEPASTTGMVGSTNDVVVIA